MSEALIDKLLESFDELDRCINLTNEVLRNKEGVPSEVLERVSQYSEIVNKQRSLAGNLRAAIETQDWEAVSRQVRVINGLSRMIRDDAQAILAGAMSGEEIPAEKSDRFLI